MVIYSHTETIQKTVSEPLSLSYEACFLLLLLLRCISVSWHISLPLLLDTTSTSCFEVIFLSVGIALRHAIKKVRREERKGNQIYNYSHLDPDLSKISRFVKITNKKPWFLFKILRCCPILKEGKLQT